MVNTSIPIPDDAVEAEHDTPFGTQVTVWYARTGPHRAVVIQRGQKWPDIANVGVYVQGTGMTHLDTRSVTLGWHPDAKG